MKKMINTIQNYSWGSKKALNELYGIPNANNQPMAELWIGAHPKSSSRIINCKGDEIALNTLIEKDVIKILGKTIAKRFGILPFLLKIICVDKPLSLQVHPSKDSARKGFIKENHTRIALDAPNRNYKDSNHKPELIFALTSFQIMSGFRALNDIFLLMKPIKSVHSSIVLFLDNPDQTNLLRLFRDLLMMTEKQKYMALDILMLTLKDKNRTLWDIIYNLSIEYPYDNSVLSPLLLNIVTLQSGQAMFIPSKVPHAYMKGIALEILASSDNVLRAGLTSKYIDIAEFISNIGYSTNLEHPSLITPKQVFNSKTFKVPVDDFSFSVHTLTSIPIIILQKSATILFCLDGQTNISSQNKKLSLQPGESSFLSNNEALISINGSGRLVHVCNEV